MKILLVQNSVYLPAHGGANKANRLLVEGLAERNHLCQVVALANMRSGSDSHSYLFYELAARGIRADSHSSTKVIFHHKGVEVHAVVKSSQLRAQVINQARIFEPDWVLVSSEDPGQILLEAALKVSHPRVVYLGHTILQFPFGPKGFLQSQAKTNLLHQVAGIITVSIYLKDYIRQWSNLESVVIPFPVYGTGPFPYFGSFEEGFVTIINPCAYKGISIFIQLARAFTHIQFAAVPTWGTTEEDKNALKREPNIHLLNPMDDIDQILAQTRILLIPSLWSEGFPLSPVEAMLRGIPVIASNSGGLPEAKLGVDYVLPVNEIEKYKDTLDNLGLPIPVVPKQDIVPWKEVLQKLLSNRDHYYHLSKTSRDVAQAFVSNVGISPFETFLKRLSTAIADGRFY